MSCNDKNDGISKEEWQSRLETFPFKQDDINKLIMNYLVTGKDSVVAREGELYSIAFVIGMWRVVACLFVCLLEKIFKHISWHI